MIDSHSHIYGPRYDQDRDQVLQRAIDVGITQLLQVGCNLEDSRQAVELAENTTGVYASVGVHPHDADTVDEAVLDGLTELSNHPKVVSWGEIGLDFFYDNSPREQQQTAFAQQLERAIDLELPVVIHTRDAEPETLAILERYPIRHGGHVHCFTGSIPMARRLLEMGFHIGFTGIITFKKAAELREVVRAVPMDRLLIETDSPYLAPIPHRGKRNEPAFVQHVADAVASIKNLPLDQVLDQTSQNFYQVYGTRMSTWETLN